MNEDCGGHEDFLMASALRAMAGQGEDKGARLRRLYAQAYRAVRSDAIALSMPLDDACFLCSELHDEVESASEGQLRLEDAEDDLLDLERALAGVTRRPRRPSPARLLEIMAEEARNPPLGADVRAMKARISELLVLEASAKGHICCGILMGSRVGGSQCQRCGSRSLAT